MTVSVLQKTPTLLIEDALPEEIYSRLEKEWPTQQLLSTEPFDDGICFRLKSDQMLKKGVVSDAWREFAEYHTSASFYNEVKNIFGDLMPDVADIDKTISPRGWDKSTGGAFQLHKQQAQITEVNKNGGRAVGDKAGDIVKTVPYKRNTFVMFCNNSTHTVHSVSARKNAVRHRRSVNIIAEFNKVAKRSMFAVKETRK